MKKFFFCASISSGCVLGTSAQAASSASTFESVACRETRLRCQAELIGDAHNVLFNHSCKKFESQKIVSGVPIEVKTLSMVHVLIEGATAEQREKMYAACQEKMNSTTHELVAKDYLDVFMQGLTLAELEDETYSLMNKPEVSILQTLIDIHPRLRAGLSPRLNSNAVASEGFFAKKVKHQEQGCKLYDIDTVRLMVPERHPQDEIELFLRKTNIQELLRRGENELFKESFKKHFPAVTAVLFFEPYPEALTIDSSSDL